MHLYAQYAAEFVMRNNNVPPFHFINFLVCESVSLLLFPGVFYKLSNGGGGRLGRVFKEGGHICKASKKTQIILLVLCNKLYVIS